MSITDDQSVKSLIERAVDEDVIKDRLVRAVQRPSPQTSLFEQEPQVLSFISEIVRPELENIGLNPEIDKMGNLVARTGKQGLGNSLLFVSYGMTGDPGSMKDPFSGKIVDGSSYAMPGECIWGRGACEQKGPLVAMISAIEIAMKSGLDFSEVIFITSTAGETGRHDSIDYIVKNDGVRADWATVGGPPKIVLANKGRIDVKVTVHGKASHSSRPWEGVNAIDGTLSVLEKLRPLMPYPSTKSHPHLGRATLVANRIESFPKATHTIQDRCEITLDRRLLPGDEPDEALEQIRNAVGTVEGYRMAVEKGAFMYASETSVDTPIVKSLSNSIRSMLGTEPEYFYSHSTIDAGYLNKAGMQTVLYGPQVPEFAHTNHDMVPIKRVVDSTKVFAHMILHGTRKT